MKLARSIAAALLLAGLASAAVANNGNLLHAVGAVNAALGGAGAAIANDTLDALSVNPALLVDLEGLRFEIGAEQLKAKNAVESAVGPFHGRTEDAGDPSVVPAVGWSLQRAESRVALGMGLLGMAGFGVDYPQDPGNPILAPQPQGFGRVYSSYQYLRIPMAAAMRVNPRLAIGATLFLGHSSLSADPAGFAAPDCSASGACYFPRALGGSSMGFGAQLGLTYRASDRWRFGLAYTTPEQAQTFKFRSTVANPNLPTYGTARTLSLELANPAVATAGVAMVANEHLTLALDYRRIFYSSAKGFGRDGQGWRDISAVAFGAQWRTKGGFALRAGYNHGESPIGSRNTFLNVPMPAVFENHASLGVGIPVLRNLDVNLGFYRAFKNRVSGPILSPAGPVPGTRVTNEMSLNSLSLTLAFHP